MITAAFVIATVAALLLGRLVRRVAPALGAVVPPRPDRWHSTPTPTMGGVAITLGTMAGLAVIARQPALIGPLADWVPVLVAALAMFVVGLLDDRLQLSPLAKLVTSLAIGAFLVFALTGAEPAGARPIYYTLIGTIWFAGVCHALNLLDNMDGLAAGVAAISALFMAFLLGEELGPTLMVSLVALAGALLGFLFWNRPPARLFMGDCGSLFIGALLGGSALVPVFHTGVAFVSPALLAVLILVVPLFDTSFVLVLRRLAGRKASKGGTDHVSHRLASLGFSGRSAVRILYLLAVAGGATAWVLKTYSIEPMLKLPLVAVFGVMLVLFGIYLARVPAYNAEDFIALQKSSFAPFLKDLAFRYHAGQVMLDLVLITVCYYLAYRIRFDGPELDTFLRYFTASYPIVLGSQVAALYSSGLYQRSWETFGLRDVAAVLRGVFFGWLMSVLAVGYYYRFAGFSYGVFAFDAALLTIAIGATRISFRAMSVVAAMRSKRSRRVLVYGAGSFGQLLAREMRANPDWNMNPVAFIDDDPMKAKRWIGGVPVRGAIDQLEVALQRYQVDEVVLSSPSINGNVERRIRDVCLRLDRPVRRLHMEIR